MQRMLVSAALMRWRIVPTLACNGAVAAELAARQPFDIVLMDMQMPVMDGVVATATIRQFEREHRVHPAVPIVAYTALDLGTDLARLARVGLSAVLPKPCSPGTLHSCLAQWCPGRLPTI
jgi:CheY-like chemotaxis protein